MPYSKKLSHLKAAISLYFAYYNCLLVVNPLKHFHNLLPGGQQH